MHDLEVNTPTTTPQHGKQNGCVERGEALTTGIWRDLGTSVSRRALGPGLWHSCSHSSGSSVALARSCEASDRELRLGANPLEPQIASLSPWRKTAGLTYLTANFCNPTNKSICLYKCINFDSIKKKALMSSLTSISSWLQVGLRTIRNIIHKLLITGFNSLVFQQAKWTSHHLSSSPTEVFGIFVERIGEKIITTATLKQGFYQQNTVLFLDVILVFIKPTAA